MICLMAMVELEPRGTANQLLPEQPVRFYNVWVKKKKNFLLVLAGSCKATDWHLFVMPSLLTVQ